MNELRPHHDAKRTSLSPVSRSSPRALDLRQTLAMPSPRKQWAIGVVLGLVIAPVLVVGVAYGVVSLGFFGAYGCSSRDHARADHLAADEALTALASTYEEAPKPQTGCEDDSRIASADLELRVGGLEETGSRSVEATLIEHGWRRTDYQPDGDAYLASCLTKLIGGKVAEAEVTYKSEYRTDRSSDFQVSVTSPPWSECGEPVDKSCSRPKSLADLQKRAEPPIYVPARSQPSRMSTCGQMASLVVDGFGMSFEARPLTDPVHCRVEGHEFMGARQEEVAGRPVYVEGGAPSIQFFVGDMSIEIYSDRRDGSADDVLAFARRLPLPPADPNAATDTPCLP